MRLTKVHIAIDCFRSIAAAKLHTAPLKTNEPQKLNLQVLHPQLSVKATSTRKGKRKRYKTHRNGVIHEVTIAIIFLKILKSKKKGLALCPRAETHTSRKRAPGKFDHFLHPAVGENRNRIQTEAGRFRKNI